MSLPAPLMFTVGLIDQITRPIAKISHAFNGLASNYQAGTMQMASGIGGIAASGYALQNALMPAIEMERALGTVKSLGVQQEALKQLANTSYDYALKYGRSATEFVGAAYEIQSAMAGETGLSSKQLSSLTFTAGITAAATKADVKTVTDYFGTMYGIFTQEAERIGKDAWAEQLAGYTALAVKNFKTDGIKIAQTFSTIGASATNAGATIGEQFAVLGLLGNTKGGSESATKYVAFLRSAANAGKSLGLNFLDSNNNLLDTATIIDKIKGKFGSSMDAIEKMSLKKAFGTDEAVEFIDLLYNSTGNLKSQIDQFKDVKGLELVNKMAEDMTDQSQRLAQSWWVIRSAFGSAILPAFNDFVKKIADMGTSVIWFTQTFPNITRHLGYLGVAMMSIVAIGGIFTAAIGGWKMAKVAWTAVTKTATWAKKAFTIASMKSLVVTSLETVMTWGMVAATKAVTIALWLGNTASKAWAFSTGILTGAFGVLRTAVVALNIAALANPLFWIPAAIVAVGALIYYWDDLKATMGEWGWVQSIVGIFNTVWGGVKSVFNDTINWIITKLNLIPGVDISSNITAGSMPSVDAISPVQANLTRGGVSQQIANANNSKSTTVGNINIYPQKVDTNFANYVEMHS